MDERGDPVLEASAGYSWLLGLGAEWQCQSMYDRVNHPPLSQEAKEKLGGPTIPLKTIPPMT